MMLKKLYTLVFVHNEQEILLGLKKRGFGLNKWNGFGGKVENKESILDAAVRELEEESSIIVKKNDLKNVGHLEFSFEGDPVTMDVRVFSTNIFEGTPKESEEMKPKWFHVNEIPYNDMWLDDRYWFPYLLKKQPFSGKFHYEGYDKILSWNIDELQSMEEYFEKKK